MVLKFTFASPTNFNQVITAMGALVKETNFDCNESGIQVQCTDSSNVALISLMMKEQAFESFKCDKPVTLGLNLEALQKVLKTCGPQDRLIVEADHEEEDVPKKTLRITVDSAGKAVKAVFNLKLIEIEQEAMGIPDYVHNCTMRLDSAELKKAISDIKDYGDTLRVRATKENVLFQTAGDLGAASSMMVVAGEDDEESKDGSRRVGLEVEIRNESGISEMVFTMRYMAMFVKAAPLCKVATFSMKDNMPSCMSFSLQEETHGYLRFLLAPKDDD